VTAEIAVYSALGAWDAGLILLRTVSREGIEMPSETQTSQRRPSTIVVGVGPESGLGAAIARRFAAEGHHIFVGGRTAGKIDAVVETIAAGGGSSEAIVMDATQEADVENLFSTAFAERADIERPSAVIFNAGNNARIDFVETTAAEFEDFWRVGCFAGFLFGRAAARHLLPLGRGTVLFTGASASLRGRPGFAHFAAAKAGLRMIAQSMAREYGPVGLHVAHVLIDGGINGERLRTLWPEALAQRGEDGLLDIEAVAEAYWQIHRQPRTAWTQELDLRPFKESF
jgi:NAD(P)-dependent dehydrogenase (short-subunit alcohol dehydrogenase family)